MVPYAKFTRCVKPRTCVTKYMSSKARHLVAEITICQLADYNSAKYLDIGS